jgi:hypothetical protein
VIELKEIVFYCRRRCILQALLLISQVPKGLFTYGYHIRLKSLIFSSSSWFDEVSTEKLMFLIMFLSFSLRITIKDKDFHDKSR